MSARNALSQQWFDPPSQQRLNPLSQQRFDPQLRRPKPIYHPLTPITTACEPSSAAISNGDTQSEGTHPTTTNVACIKKWACKVWKWLTAMRNGGELESRHFFLSEENTA